MTPINTDEREVHVYAHPQEHSDDQAQESEEEVMLQIHLDVQSVMWWIHCAAHSSLFSCIVFSTLQQSHRGVFVLFVLVTLH